MPAVINSPPVEQEVCFMDEEALLEHQRTLSTECAESVLMNTNDLTEDFFIENEEDMDDKTTTDDKENTNNNVDLIKVNIDQHQIDSDLKLTQKQNPNPKVREQVIALKRFLFRYFSSICTYLSNL